MKIKLLLRKWELLQFLLFNLLFFIVIPGWAYGSNGPADEMSGFSNDGDTLKTVTINGVVTDEFGETLPGVSILVKGTTIGTITDIGGQYNLSVQVGDTLSFSFVGYETIEVEVDGSRTVIDINLLPDIISLGEVVVVGYGEQKKASVVGAIVQTKGEDLLRVGAVNTISESLQGLLPGVTAINTNGKPGSDAADIFIRGAEDAPLVLVDGVVRDFNDIDPNEIQTVSVLKDASATAVYGVRGGNGVILVTTKRGEIGKPTINFSVNFGFKRPTITQENADYITAMEMFNEAAANDNLWDQVIPEAEIQAWRENIDRAGPYNQYFPQVEWWDELIAEVGYQQRYNLNMRGGTKFVKYFVSLGYVNDGDIYNTEENDQFDPSFRLERYNWRSNLDFKITGTTEFSLNLAGNFRYRNQPGYRIDGGGEGLDNLGRPSFGEPQFFNRMFQAPKNLFPLRYEDGTYGDSQSGEHNMFMNLNEGGQRIYKYYEGLYDAILKQKLDFITKGLSVKALVSFSSGSNYESFILRTGIGGGFANINVIRNFRDYDVTRPLETGGYPLLSAIRWPDEVTQEGPLTANYDNIFAYNRRLYYELSARYKRTFGKHAFTGLILWNRLNRLRYARRSNSNNISFPFLREEYVARVTYAYDIRYLFEFNGAASGSERFAPGERYGYFPSVSAGWVISEEKWVRQFTGSFLNLLKVRYSYGQSGDDGNQRFIYLQQFTRGGNIRLGLNSATNIGPLFNEGKAANINATWSTSTTQNLGIDFDLIDKISGSIDFFRTEEDGILITRKSVPRWFGNTSPEANIREEKYKGFEIELGWNDRIGANFRYYIRGNFSWFDTRIVFADDPARQADYLKDESKPLRYQRRHINGGYYNSLDDIYNYTTPNQGIAPAALVPGDFLYVDYNADGITDNLDAAPMEHALRPQTTCGLNVGFSWKNLDFNALLYGVTDVSFEIPDLILWDFPNNFIMAQTDVTSRWTVNNPEGAKKPSLHIANTAHNFTNSTYSYVDGTYIRLKNAELSYRIKLARLENLGIKKLQLYVNGNNLLTFTKLDPRIDPETNGTSVYPVVRRYNAGFRMSF